MADTAKKAGPNPTALSRRQITSLPLILGAGLVASTSAIPLNPAHAKKRSVGPSLQDRAGIQDLFSTYLWAYDCSDLDLFLDLFTNDAVVVGLGKVHEGKPAIGAWFQYLLNIRDSDGDDAWLHEAGQLRFDGDSKRCIVYAYATHFNSNPEKKSRGVRSLGYFATECVKHADGWRFRRFSIAHWDKSSVPWKKALPWEAAKQS